MKILIGKAGFVVCLFLFLSHDAPAASPPLTDESSVEQWTFGEKARQAYDLIFSLDLNGVHRIIP